MKVKIEIPKIHCARTTKEWGKDEIFCGILLIAGKLQNGDFIPSSQNSLFGAVTEVKKDVKNNTAWRPKENDFELTIDDDVKVIGITTVLYERDKGDIHKEIKEKFNEIKKPEVFDWTFIVKEIKELVIKDVNENGETDFEDILQAITTKPTLTPLIIGNFLFKIAKVVIKHLRQDDLLGIHDHAIDFSKEGFDLSREHKFTKHRGKYYVSIKVSKAE